MWYSPNVLFLNLMYCRVQYNTANKNKNNYSAPSIPSLVWNRPKNLFNITGYTGPGQTAGGKSSRMPDVLLSLFTNNILSHVVNIALHSVSITWCKLWQQFGWQLLYWNAEGCTSYLCHISIWKVHITVCGILIEKDWIWFSYTFTSGLTKKKKKKHTLLRHCEIEKKNKYVHKGENKNEKVHWQNVLLLCCPLSMYAFKSKVDEMHLWAISENWFIIGWSIFSSLLKVKIHLNNSFQIYYSKSLIEMCRKYAWKFMTTRSTILYLP